MKSANVCAFGHKKPPVHEEQAIQRKVVNTPHINNMESVTRNLLVVKEKHMNAVIYARYSSSGQTEQSIEGQLRDNYEFAKRENLTVIAEYIDRARTGRTDNRDQFQQMIRDAAKKQFQVVIVWKMDRFARNRYDSAIYKSKLKKYGIKILSCQENITDNPEGIILEGMLEAMAEYYSANLSVNVKRGQRETVLKGRYCGGHIPYGYKSENGHLIPDERTAPIIRYVFEEYARGIPKRKIIEALKDRGVLSPDGRSLCLSSFQTALRSSVYCGEFVWNGNVVEGCATPIISRETFDAVQMRLNKNKRSAASALAKEPYLLQGKIFCGKCGCNMVGDSGKSSTGKVYQYYACAGKKKKHTCDKKSEKKDLIESYVIDQTISYVLEPDNIMMIAGSVAEQYKKEFSQESVTELDKQISRIDGDINTLVDTLLEIPKSARQRIYDKIESLENQKSDLKSELAKLRIAASVTVTPDEIATFIRQFVTSPDDMTIERKQQIIDTFINSVYIYDDCIEIYYNTNNQPTPPHTKRTQTKETTHTTKSSDTKVLATPFNPMSERVFVFEHDKFGIVLPLIRK